MLISSFNIKREIGGVNLKNLVLISLVGYPYKLLVKVLVNRLKRVVNGLVYLQPVFCGWQTSSRCGSKSEAIDCKNQE